MNLHRHTLLVLSHFDMSSKGWLNLEAAPDSAFFEGDSAFSFLGLTRTQRLYGFLGWSVLAFFSLALLTPRSLVVGFALSLLGSILLFMGQLSSFARMSSI